MAVANLYGLLAEFDDPNELVAASHHVLAAGYRRFDAYSPFPVHGLADAVGFYKTRISLVVLVGGILGGVGGYIMQYWMTVIDYPINVGGRPLHSWPSFLPATFECTILLAALSGVLGMLALNGLPRPHHPLFNVPEFDRASSDRFFLCVEARDPQFHEETTRKLLESLKPVGVFDVPQ